MSFRVDERAPDVRVIDRFDGGVGWIAHPEETIQRASHALAVDGDVWAVDPVDGEGVDALLADLGDVAGIVVLLDRHVRDAETLANRHDVPVYLPDWFDGVAAQLDAPTARFGAGLADSGVESHLVRNGPFWQEAALFDPAARTLVVADALGTIDHFRAGDERLGVHPKLRPIPPRTQLGDLQPERILVGHGEGIATDADRALADALDGARRRAPRLYAETIRRFSPL